MNISQAIAQLEALENGIEAAIEGAVAEIAEIGAEDGRARSDGGMSYAEMRRLDHPKARRHGRPRTDMGVINRHRGVFYAAWRSTRNQVINDSDVADFIQYGTQFMFESPISMLVEGTMAEKAPAVLEKHLRPLLP